MPLIKETIRIDHDKITGFKCDKCNKIYSGPEELDNVFYEEKECGYFSIWGDLTTYELSICQYCFYDMFKDIAQIEDDYERP